MERYALMDCARMFEMMERMVPWIVEMTTGDEDMFFFFFFVAVGKYVYILIGFYMSEIIILKKG